MFIGRVNQGGIEMNELKTLGDLTGMIGMLPLKSDILDINVVKVEAIKWVKGKDMEVCPYCKSLFLEFHNITDEDLKTKSQEV